MRIHVPRSARWSFAVLVIGMALVGGACAADGPDADVVVLGDSITFLAGGPIHDALDAASPDPFVWARPGATVTDLLTDAEGEVPRIARVVVINIGTNDVYSSIDLAELRNRLDELVSIYDDSRCVGLATISEAMPRRPDIDVRSRAAALNEAIESIADEDPRVEVLDWNQRLGSAEQPLLYDDVHPNEAGQLALTDLYVGFVEACPAD